MTEQDQIAAFIRKRGVTRVSEGERTLSYAQIYKAIRGEGTDNDRIAERHVVVDHIGRKRVRNGVGEWIG